MKNPHNKAENRRKSPSTTKEEESSITLSPTLYRRTITRNALLATLIIGTILFFSSKKIGNSASASNEETKQQSPLSSSEKNNFSSAFNKIGQYREEDPIKAGELLSIITKHLQVNKEELISEELFMALGRDLLAKQSFHNILNKYRRNPEDKVPVSLETLTLFLNPTLLSMKPSHIIYIDTTKGTIGLFTVSTKKGQK